MMFLPQYNPYQRSEGDVAAAMAMAALLWGLMILLGLFLLSAWCTKLVLQHLINPYLDGVLDREDGLIVVWSTLIWAALGLICSIPMTVADPNLALSVLGAGIAGGVAWGASIGAFLVVMLWLEVDEPWEPTHGFEAITNLPGEHYRPAALDAAHEPEPTLAEIEAMLRGDIGLDGPEADPLIPSEDLPQPAASPIPSENGQSAESVGV